MKWNVILRNNFNYINSINLQSRLSHPKLNSNHEFNSILPGETMLEMCVQMCAVGCVQMSKGGFPRHVKQPRSLKSFCQREDVDFQPLRPSNPLPSWATCCCVRMKSLLNKTWPPPEPDSQSKLPFGRRAFTQWVFFLPQVAALVSSKNFMILNLWRASDLY